MAARGAQPTVLESAFLRAVVRFKSSLDKKDLKEFESITTEDSVRHMLEEIERKQAERRELQNLSRIQPFLQFMKQYSGAIQVFVGAKQEILSLIWGPLKLLLQIASQYVNAFDSLLSALEKIGEAAPRAERYSSIFKASNRMQSVIALIYIDILEFYRHSYKIFRRRSWKLIFSLAWADFETRFGTIIQNFERHRDLIDSEAQAEAFERAEHDRTVAQAALEDKLKESRAYKREKCGKWLSPADAGDFKDHALNKRTPETGKWLLELPEIREWAEGKKSVWLRGKPGAGKTILTSILIEHIEQKKKDEGREVPTLYFFCSYKQPDKNTCDAVLRSLIMQLMNSDELLVPYIYEEYTRSPQLPGSQRCKGLLKQLVGAAVPPGERLHIIIDGIDELPESERAMLLQTLSDLLRNSSESIAFFLSSQDLHDIRNVAGKGPRSPKRFNIVDINDRNSSDISLYIKSATEDFMVQFFGEEDVNDELAETMHTEIESKLLLNACGMFLYVRLIMDELASQTSIKEVRQILDGLPKGLNGAYERILDRIEQLQGSMKAVTIRVLGWLAISTRQLTLGELEDACAIYANPYAEAIDPESRPMGSQLRNGCGSLVEITGEDIVTFVHDSARRYFLQPQCRSPLVTELSLHTDMAIVCAAYLCFRCYHRAEAQNTHLIRTEILTGVLRLREYVQFCWVRHVLYVFGNSTGGQQASIKILNDRLRRFFELHLTQSLQAEQTLQNVSLTAPLDIAVAMKAFMEFQMQAPRKDIEDPSDFSECASTVYDALENPLAEDNDTSQLQRLLKLYGQFLYKCRNLGCHERAFASADERLKHEELHDSPLKCTQCGEGLRDKAALRSHMKNYHEEFRPMKRRAKSALEALDRASKRILTAEPVDWRKFDILASDISALDLSKIPSNIHKERLNYNCTTNPDAPEKISIDHSYTLKIDKNDGIKGSHFHFSNDGKTILLSTESGGYLYNEIHGEFSMVHHVSVRDGGRLYSTALDVAGLGLVQLIGTSPTKIVERNESKLSVEITYNENGWMTPSIQNLEPMAIHQADLILHKIVLRFEDNLIIYAHNRALRLWERGRKGFELNKKKCHDIQSASGIGRIVDLALNFKAIGIVREHGAMPVVEVFDRQTCMRLFSYDGHRKLAPSDLGPEAIAISLTSTDMSTGSPNCLAYAQSNNALPPSIINLQLFQDKSWSVGTGDQRSISQILALEGFELHHERVASISVSGYGTKEPRQILVSAGKDKCVRLWNTRTGLLLVVLRVKKGAVISAKISGHGDRLITLSDDGTVCVWTIDYRNQLFALEKYNKARLLADRQVAKQDALVEDNVAESRSFMILDSNQKDNERLLVIHRKPQQQQEDEYSLSNAQTSETEPPNPFPFNDVTISLSTTPEWIAEKPPYITGNRNKVDGPHYESTAYHSLLTGSNTAVNSLKSDTPELYNTVKSDEIAMRLFDWNSDLGFDDVFGPDSDFEEQF